ncbi:MAG: MerR family transcriptional regulator [Clostridiales bacterium]|nr:MerR family transcriptional regulator [Clostridiales bacterium]
MGKDAFLTVSEFAGYSRTTTDTLRYYEKIGLLIPSRRGENNYRYYTTEQLALVNVVRTLQSLGMSLSEIMDLRDTRTADMTNSVFSAQIIKIDKKIDEWERARKLLTTYQKMIRSVDGVDIDGITVEFLPAEAIIMGDINDYSRDRNDNDALASFYADIQLKHPGVDLNYPVWGMFKKERIINGDFNFPDRYYFYNPEGRDKRPAGLFAVGYAKGGYGRKGEVFSRILEYAGKHKYEVCGDAYEEYRLNEVCVSGESNYLVRVMIEVRKK